MKNLYALNSKSEIIHIDNVTKNFKEKYYCINCGNELIARKGKIRKHHFSHKNITNCSFESYLHKLGKKIFYNTYTKALNNNLPFFVEYVSKKTCTSCKNIPEINKECEFKEQINKYDITKSFDLIEVEKGIDGYIADILLSSSINNNKILIEIAVTHVCEEEKINSGNRIIEFNIRNEDDLDLLHKNTIKVNSTKIKFYNFKKQIIKKNIYKPNTCLKKINIFKILKNGKAIRSEIPIKQVIYEIKQKDKFLHYEILSSNEQKENYEFDYFNSGSIYIDLIKEASLNGIQVINCYACRFSANNEHPYASTSLMCRKHYKEIENSNDAVNCNSFWRIKDRVQYPSKYRNYKNYDDWR